ncbi:hypothetical protein CBF23_012720 [Marinomonas agarivorans]|nr:hypothetical protein CBF23_012720 [Marinomonas agarivorans]
MGTKDVNAVVPSVRMEFDAVGIDQLEQLLRERIACFRTSQQQINGKLHKGSLKLLSDITGVSSACLSKFYHGKSLRLDSMNKLAYHFNIQYVVTNFFPKVEPKSKEK